VKAKGISRGIGFTGDGRAGFGIWACRKVEEPKKERNACESERMEIMKRNEAKRKILVHPSKEKKEKTTHHAANTRVSIGSST
jgi:hypothetical protein